jgi:flagellar hook-associated protein 2
MGRISTNIGLITGFPITETVDKLVSLEARSRDLLVAKNKTIESQKNAVTQLTALLISLQFTTNKLTTASLYQQRTVTSSNEDLLTVTSTGQPPLGAYQVTPIQVAQSQQLQSSRFTSSTAPLAAGKFTFRHGGFIDSGASLDLLKSGEGFSRGRIRVTDRSGTSSEIDLSYARDVDDVLKAINSNGTINVRAEVRGDHIALVDLTGQSVSNLKVQEVGGGQTADSL